MTQNSVSRGANKTLIFRQLYDYLLKILYLQKGQLLFKYNSAPPHIVNFQFNMTTRSLQEPIETILSRYLMVDFLGNFYCSHVTLHYLLGNWEGFLASKKSKSIKNIKVKLNPSMEIFPFIFQSALCLDFFQRFLVLFGAVYLRNSILISRGT